MAWSTGPFSLRRGHVIGALPAAFGREEDHKDTDIISVAHAIVATFCRPAVLSDGIYRLARSCRVAFGFRDCLGHFLVAHDLPHSV